MIPRIHRLPSHEISSVRAVGKPFRTQYFDYYARAGRARFAVIVGSHIDKRAVVRNRIKRLVYEAIRLHGSLPSVDGILVVRRKFPKDFTYENVSPFIHSML